MPETRQYFNVYFPENSVTTGSRYFFFQSLEGTELGSAVEKILTSNLNSITPDNDEGLEIIRGAMDFLKAMIENEQQNEREYFMTNIANNDKLTPGIRKRCSDILSAEGTIDYIGFINMINEYYTGLDAYKKNLKYESERLTKLQQLYSEFHKHYTQNPDGTYTIQVKNKEKNLLEYQDSSFYTAFRQFLIEGAKDDKNWVSKEDSRLGLNTKTMANTIQNQFSSIYNKIWNNTDFRTQIENAVLNTGLKGYEQQVTTYLIQEILMESQGMLTKYFNEEEYKVTLSQTEVNNFVQAFLDKLNIQPGETTSMALERHLLTSLKGEAEILLKAEQQLTLSTDRIIKEVTNDVVLSIGDDGHSINNLSQDIINLIQSILAKNKKKTSVSNKKVWTKDNLFQALSETYRNRPIKIKAKKWNTQEIVEIANSLIKNQKLVKVQIAAKDNIISEGFSSWALNKASALTGRLRAIFLTFGTQKADVAGIEIGKVTLIPQNVDWAHIAQQITKNYMDSLEITDVDINSKNIKFNEKTFRQDKHFGSQEFSIEAETMRRLAVKEKEIEQITTQLKRKGIKADEIQQVLSNLKNSVSIGSTVKSYNKYDNEHGFHGGSIGGTVEHQLENIQKMFQYGGISFPDVEWLTFAIYNAGAGLMGAEYKEPIENILSTVAVMLMFDDAGQQAVYLREQLDERYRLSSYNGSKFLHLYYLNGNYYPSSFILQLTYNGLLDAYSQLNREYLKGTEAFKGISNGSRANIINNVSEKNEVGTKTSNDIVTTKQSQWAETFAANSKSVQIQITFLAGMIDIIDILNGYL